MDSYPGDCWVRLIGGACWRGWAKWRWWPVRVLGPLLTWDVVINYPAGTPWQYDLPPGLQPFRCLY